MQTQGQNGPIVAPIRPPGTRLASPHSGSASHGATTWRPLPPSSGRWSRTSMRPILPILARNAAQELRKSEHFSRNAGTIILAAKLRGGLRSPADRRAGAATRRVSMTRLMLTDRPLHPAGRARRRRLPQGPDEPARISRHDGRVRRQRCRRADARRPRPLDRQGGGAQARRRAAGGDERQGLARSAHLRRRRNVERRAPVQRVSRSLEPRLHASSRGCSRAGRPATMPAFSPSTSARASSWSNGDAFNADDVVHNLTRWCDAARRRQFGRRADGRAGQPRHQEGRRGRHRAGRRLHGASQPAEGRHLADRRHGRLSGADHAPQL